MINRDRMIFFNTAHMNYYQGNWQLDVPVNGGSFIRANGWGGEVFNFKSFQGWMYGYVEPGLVAVGGRQRNINISRLSRPGERQIGYVADVLIAWIARPPNSDDTVFIGWYENATVYRICHHMLDDPNRILPNNSFDYFTRAREEDCHLIPSAQRNIVIPRGIDGGLGHSNIWYADSAIGEQIKTRVIQYISIFKQHN